MQAYPMDSCLRRNDGGTVSRVNRITLEAHTSFIPASAGTKVEQVLNHYFFDRVSWGSVRPCSESSINLTRRDCLVVSCLALTTHQMAAFR